MFGIGPLPYKELYSRDERSAYEPHQHAPVQPTLCTFACFECVPASLLFHFWCVSDSSHFRPIMVARFLVEVLVLCGALAVAMGVGLDHNLT